MHHLKAKVATGKCPPKDECIFLIDGNARLQSCVHLPEIFEDLAAQIFGYLPKCQETHCNVNCPVSTSINKMIRRHTKIIITVVSYLHLNEKLQLFGTAAATN